MAEKKIKSETERLREEIADLKAGRAFHFHEPRDGSAPFRCCSPYCEDLGSAEPQGAPGLVSDDTTRYLR